MSNKSLATLPVNASRADRQRAIDEAVKRKKDAPAKGGVEEKRENATKPGIVKPSKPERPTKIPKKLNEVKDDDTDTVTEGDIRDRLDEETDEVVVEKPKKPAKDPSMLTVGDVARELGIDPKRARARLRAAGQKANEGRWPKVKRGSKEYDALVVALSPDEGPDDEDADE